MISITTKYKILSDASLYPGVKMSLNSILYLSSFAKNLLTYTFDSYTIQVVMFVRPTVSELRFLDVVILVNTCLRSMINILI